MKHVKLFEQFINESARLRSKRDWKKDIADELGADRKGIISDDVDGDEVGEDFEGYFKAEYDGYTGFYITLFTEDDEEVDDDNVDCEGMGSSEIREAIWDAVWDMVSSPYRKGR
jgi:hypothetical protein